MDLLVTSFILTYLTRSNSEWQLLSTSHSQFNNFLLITWYAAAFQCSFICARKT